MERPPEIATPSAPVADPMVPSVARVRHLHEEADGVFTLDFEPIEMKGAEPSFAPGQFNMLSVFGVGEAAISLSGDPVNQAVFTHTIRAVGSVSTALTQLKPGEAVGLRGPFGTCWPMAEAAGQDVIVVAGGLGLAPLRPVLYSLLAERERYGKIVLLYGTRSPDQILYRSEIASWRCRRDIDIEVTVDHATSDWHGHVGVVTKLISRASFDPFQSIAFVCGPEVMMRFAIAALRDREIAEESIYLSMERNMKCAIGFCGHCQFGPFFVCRDGPVFRYDRVREPLALREI